MTPRSRSPLLARRTRRVSVAALFVATLAVAASTASASTVITWTNAAGGLWSDPGNWSPANVPDTPGEAAVLPALSGGYQVTLDLQPAIDQLDVAAGDPTLDLAGFSLGPIAKVENYGTIKNFTGYYNSVSIRNHTGGLIQGALDGVITAGESIDSDGTIEVGPGALSMLDAPTGLALMGSGRLHLNRSTIFDPQGDFGGVLVVRSTFTLSGTGLISKRVANYGTLECTESRPNLKIDGLLFNYGTTRVSGGGKIIVNRPLVKGSGTITSGPGGGTFSLRLDSGNLGSLALDGNGRLVVDGGDLDLACGMLLEGQIQRVGSTGTLNVEIANLQNITIAPGADVTVSGHADLMVEMQHFVNHGTLHVKGSMHFGILDTPHTFPLEGSGVLKLEGGRLGSGNGGVLLNPAGMTIEGCGTINPPFINEGTLNLECGTSVIGAPGLWRNRGTLRVRGGKLTVSGANTVLRNQGRFEVQKQVTIEQGATLDNTGSAITAAGGRVVLGGIARSTRGVVTTSPGTIRGGKLDATGAGEYFVQSLATLDRVELTAPASLVTATGTITQLTGSGFTNRGTVRILGTGRMELPSTTRYVQPGGLTSLEGGTLAGPSVQIQGGTLRGFGTVAGSIENGGVVSPELGAVGIRVLGDYRQLASGVLESLIAGPAAGQTGRLVVSGRATLDGSMAPLLAGGYEPAAGQAFDVLRYASFDGSFKAVVGSVGPRASAAGLVPIFAEDGMKLMSIATTGVGDPEPSVAAVLRFQSRRTPQGASFVLELPYAAELDGRLYDAAGREVARLVEGARPAGVHSFAVGGSGASVRGLASGIYFARLGIVAGGVREVRTARVALLH